MANKIQIKRGLAANLPVLSDGEPAWTTDTFRMYFGQGGVNKLVGEADFLKLCGGTLTGALALAADPTLALHAATKQYVDGLIEGIKAKSSVKCATTGNIVLTNYNQAIDGVTPVVGDRVLVKNQSNPEFNGIYVAVLAGSLQRADDASTWSELISSFVWVEQGNTQADTGWLCTVDAGGTLNTTAVTFVQFSGAGQITTGNGLTKTGNTIDAVAGDGIAVAADAISVGIDTGAGLKFDASSPKKIQVNLSTDLEFTTGAIRVKAFTGDVTKAAGGTVLTIANAAVTLAKMANLAQNTIIGRVTASTGVPEALTAANVRSIINVADGATANAKATGAELDTATDDVKFATAKALKDSHNVPSVAPGLSGNILTSNGTDWTSAAPPATHTQNTDTGTTSDTFQLKTGSAGPKLRVGTPSGIEIRSADLNSYLPIAASLLSLQGGSYASTIYPATAANAQMTLPSVNSGILLCDSSVIDGGTW